MLLATAASGGDSTPADPVTRSLRWDDGNNSNFYKATGSTDTTWTIAMWVKRANLGSLQYLFSWGGDGIAFDANDKISIWNGSSYATSTAVFRDTSSWYHLTVSCSSGAITVYVNGTAQTMSSSPSYPAWGNVYFGRWSGNTSYNFDGYLSDIYGIEGSALDHTSFTESNNYGGLIPKAYTGSVGTNGFHIDAQPAHDADLLVSSIDRNNGDTLFADCAGHTITKGGDPEHSIAVGNPFTGDDRSMFFDGSDDYIKVASASSDFAFGTSDYTIEGWFNFRHLTGVQTICDLRPYNSIDTTRSFFGTTGSGLYVYFNGGNTTLAASGSLTIDRWHHIAFVRSSSSLKCYVDGQLKGTISSSTNHNTDGTPHLGSTATHTDLGDSNHEAFLQGYVYDFRIINGTAAYTGEFTPPSGKLTATGGTYPSTTNVNTSITSGHTKLLIQPDKDDSSIGDETSNHTITTSGALITASSAYESAAKSTAMYFDGNGDTIVAAASSDFAFGTGDFTVEGWYYFESIPSSTDAMLVDLRPTNSTDTDTFAFSTDTTNGVKVYSGGDYALGGSLSTSTWHHIALVRSGGTLYVYIDGTATGSTQSYSNNLTQNSTPRLGTTADGGTSAVFTGYIFDVRITKGTARYTSNFTTPSAPFELNPVYIGGDQSGNKNHFAPTNISDLMLDTPTKNYATLNPLDAGGGTFSEGNLKWAAGGSHRAVRFTQATLAGDKTYFEVYYPDSWSNDPSIGIMGAESKIGDQHNASPARWFRAGGTEFNNGTESDPSNPTWTNGDIVGVAVDLVAGELKYQVNGGSFTTAFTGLSNDTTWIPAIKGYDTSPAYIINTGGDNTFCGEKTSGQDTSQSEFYYAPPSGFKSLNSSNLATPTVTPSEHFGILTYTGNSDLYNGSGSTQNVTGVNFDVGMAWIKDRDNRASDSYTGSMSEEYGHYLFDTITGTSTGGYNIDYDVASGMGGGAYLNSGESGVTSFSAGSGTSRGITVDEAGETNFYFNDGFFETYTERYVAWLWKLGSTGSSSTWNSSYTAPTTEHYNASAGVTTIEVSPASSGNLEVAHSLSEAPEFFWVAADQEDSDFSGFPAFHKDLSSGTYLQLDGTSAASSNSNYFPSGAAHADYIKLGSAFIDSFGSGFNLRIWAFTSVEGYSKFGSYVGNLSTDGTFIYTGFRPRFIMIKNIQDSGHSWYIHDTARSPHNYSDLELTANSSGAEYSVMTAASVERMDINSNGFKLRGNNVATNANGKTHIYAAWAEVPFAKATAR